MNSTRIKSNWASRMMQVSGVLLLFSAGGVQAQKYSLKSWGYEESGRLGNGISSPFSHVLIPTDVYTDTGYGGKFVMVSAGNKFSVGIKEDGSLWAWGSNDFNQLGIPALATTDVVTTPRIVDSGKNGAWWKISAGYASCVALKRDSTLWTWGRAAEGQLGNGTTTPNVNVPTQIMPALRFKDVNSNGISAPSFPFSINRTGVGAISADGSLYTWGSNNTGGLGSGSTSLSITPDKRTLINSTYRQISFGTQGHTAAIVEDSTLWTWGWNSAGQLGIGSTSDQYTPTKVGTDKWLVVATGQVHTAAIRADGSLWAWGSGSNYRLGNGLSNNYEIPVLVDDGTNGKWVKVVLNDDAGMGVKEDGSIWTWGNNLRGTIGNGTDNNSSRNPYKLPVRFVTLEGVSIEFKQFHVLASGIWYYECEKPVVHVSNLGVTADITWPKVTGVASYEIAIDRAATKQPLATPNVITDTFYNSGNMLTAFERYYVHFRSNCGYGNYSDWDTISFVAPFQCRTPNSLEAVQIGTDSVIFSWNRADSTRAYEIVIDQTAALTPTGTTVSTNDTFYRSGKTLNPDELYYAHIRTHCTNNEYSAWDTVSFRTLPLCLLPADVTLTSVSTDSASFRWNGEVLGLYYEVAVDQSATLNPGSAPVQLTDTVFHTGAVLADDLDYYMHIRTYCGNDNYSAWDTLHFKTSKTESPESILLTELASMISVYPNPVSNQLYIATPVALTANVFSMDGKKLINHVQVSKSIDVSQLASGVYFLELMNAEGIIVKTLRFTRAGQ